MIHGTISSDKPLNGTVTAGGGTSDHNRLHNRDLHDQHPIEAITDLAKILNEKLDSATIKPIIQQLKEGLDEALKFKAKGLYYDSMKEFARKPYWYVTSETDPKTGLGTKESIISGPYDLGQGGGSGGGVTTVTLKRLNWPSTVSVGSPLTLSVMWSSTIGDEKEPTGNGSLYLLVNNKQVEVKPNQPQGICNFDVTKYIIAGTNVIQIKVLDSYGTSGTTVGTINAVTLELRSSFNANLVYPLEGTPGINFTYTPFGDIEKTVHIFVDGVECGTQIVKSTGEQQTFYISPLSHGDHEIKAHFTAAIDGQEVSSNEIKYAVIYRIAGNKKPIIASDFSDLEQEQYIPFNIPYRVFVEDKNLFDVSFHVNGELVEQLTIGPGGHQWEYKNDVPGTYELKIQCGETHKAFNVRIKASQIDVKPVVQNLKLALAAQGRSNAEDPDRRVIWEDADRGIRCTLTNFNWSSDGWLRDSSNNTILRITGDARVSIPFKPFLDDFKATGKTIELEIATSTIRDYSTIIVNCFDGSRGFYITPQIAVFKSQQSELSTQYKEDEHVRLTFVIEKNTDNRIIWMYVNGIASGACQYPIDDSFRQLQPTDITIGSNDATIDIYNIRVYDNNLTSRQVVNNWIADTQIASLKADRYYRNDNYNDKNELVIEKLPSSLPYIIWDINPLPEYKGDKRLGNARYVEPGDTSRSFTAENATYNVQGTSSAVYPTKNIRIKYKANKDYPQSNFSWYDDNGDEIKKFKITKDGIGDNYFTYKVDFASSEGANNVELTKLYNDASKERGILTPPQRQDGKVRVGVDGFPIVAFHRDADGKDVFCTKANFNNDKANEDVYGFADGDESWEITNNTSDLAKFKIPATAENFNSAFEIRFPDEDGYSKMDKLTPMTTWVASTYRANATGAELPEPITYEYTETVRAEDGSYSAITKTESFTHDTERYRLIKFKAELKDWFNVDSCIFYYIFTHLYLMIDSRAKNAFPTYFKSRVDGDGGNRWFWLPYDMDTAIGIDNKGKLSFDYSLEDTDKIGGADVFNGQDSVMWCNLRDSFDGEIGEMYSMLRTQRIISYEETEKRFEEHQNQWSENIFNEDSKIKYITPLAHGDNYLEMLQGGKIEQRKWWLYNRFKYMDSKYTAGDAKSDFIQFRAYVESGVEKPDITIIPYADIYATVSYSNGVAGTKQVRAKRNEPTIVHNPFSKEEAETDQETYIYSASQLASIGDISGFKPDTVKVGNAIKLQELKVGDASPDYSNPHLTELTLGSNTLLKTLDVRNCVNLRQPIDVSGCTNIEEIYFDGTQITGINLPDGGILKHLHLPSTLTKLTLKNQPLLTDLQLANVENIESLWLENIPSQVIDTSTIVSQIRENSAIRLIGINEFNLNETQVGALYNRLDLMKGLDSGGEVIAKAQVTGAINLKVISYANYVDFTTRYPEVKINADQIICTVTFMNEGSVFASENVVKGTSAHNPGIPEKPSTQAHYYTFNSWDKSYENIQSDIIINAIFDEHLRSYTITYNPQSSVIKLDKYSDTAEYGSKVSQPNVIEIPEHVALIGWFKEDGTAWNFDADVILGDTEIFAKWQDDSKPTVSVARKSFNTFTYEGRDNVGISAWAVTNNEEEPVDWTAITPTTHFVGEYAVTSYGDYYFWVKDSQNNTAAAKIISHQINKNIAVGITCNLFENAIALSDFALAGTQTTIGYSLDEHYENESLTVNGETAKAGDTVFVDKTINIVARCSPKSYTVSFNMMGKGKAIEPQSVAYLTMATKPLGQYHPGFVIDGWYKEEVLVNEWDFAHDPVLGDTELFAKWVPYQMPSKITVEIPSDNKEISLNYYQKTAEKVEVIWNSNESEELWEKEVTVFYGSAQLIELTHTYRTAGTYTIAITAINGVCELGNSSKKKAVVPIEYVTDVEFSWDMSQTRNYAFQGSSISNLKLTEYMTRIAIGSFSLCNNFTSLHLPDSIVEIADQAFEGCRNIVEPIILPKNLEVLGNYVFQDCSSLEGIVFNTKLSYIGKYDFRDCTALRDVVFPENIKVIKDNAFDGCTSLTSIEIPETVEQIESQVFSNCYGLEKVTLNCLDTCVFGDSVFRNCYNLVTAGTSDACDITFNFKTVIPENIFSSSGIAAIEFPNTLATIGSRALADSKLTSIDIPFSVTSIGKNAFSRTPIRSATIRAISSNIKIDWVEDAWFFGCSSQAVLYVDTFLSSDQKLIEAFGPYWNSYSEDGYLAWATIDD